MIAEAALKLYKTALDASPRLSMNERLSSSNDRRKLSGRLFKLVRSIVQSKDWLYYLYYFTETGFLVQMVQLYYALTVCTAHLVYREISCSPCESVSYDIDHSSIFALNDSHRPDCSGISQKCFCHFLVEMSKRHNFTVNNMIGVSLAFGQTASSVASDDFCENDFIQSWFPSSDDQRWF